jgi:hypothetical protein
MRAVVYERDTREAGLKGLPVPRSKGRERTVSSSSTRTSRARSVRCAVRGMYATCSGGKVLLSIEAEGR